MISLLWRVGLGAALVGFGVSCTSSPLYEKRVELPGVWTYADSLGFEFEVVDTTARYDLVMTLAHSPEFANENLYTLIRTTYPDGRVVSDQVNLSLADTYGNWHGACSGETCTLDIELQRGARFDESGSYRLSVHQYSRIDSLAGVSGVGLRVSPSEKSAQ